MKAIIFNSGLGKRMGELTKDNPKCMVKLLNGESIFERQLRLLEECGINDVVITTGPFAEQLEIVSKKFSKLNIKFVNNPVYDKTNYIYSMYLAKDYLDDDFILLHGDLVFNKELLQLMVSNNDRSLCLINENKKLPEKDFKGRIENGLLKEVSINIFDKNCYAFQPLYRLRKCDLIAWISKVEEFINDGNNGVYAENALNTILKDMEIHAISYSEDYIDEVDNKEDLIRVSGEIEEFENSKIEHKVR